MQRAKAAVQRRKFAVIAAKHTWESDGFVEVVTLALAGLAFSLHVVAEIGPETLQLMFLQ